MSELALLTQEFRDATMAANARLDTRFVEAMNNKDVDSALDCFSQSPDLVVLRFGKVLRGPAALRQFLAELFSAMKTIRGDIHEVTRWTIGETVFAVGTATYEFETLDGKSLTRKECWTDARQKVAGRWIYVIDHVEQIA